MKFHRYNPPPGKNPPASHGLRDTKATDVVCKCFVIFFFNFHQAFHSPCSSVRICDVVVPERPAMRLCAFVALINVSVQVLATGGEE